MLILSKNGFRRRDGSESRQTRMHQSPDASSRVREAPQIEAASCRSARVVDITIRTADPVRKRRRVVGLPPGKAAGFGVRDGGGPGVGPGGHFLGTAHTRRSNLFIFPSQNNTTFEQWEAEGCKSSEQVGIEKARTWLDRYEPPEMDSSLKEGLDDFVNERESAIPKTLE